MPTKPPESIDDPDYSLETGFLVHVVPVARLMQWCVLLHPPVCTSAACLVPPVTRLDSVACPEAPLCSSAVVFYTMTSSVDYTSA